MRNSLTLALCLLLAACGPLVKIGESGPAPQRFTLQVADKEATPLALPVIRVEEFDAPAELAPNRMAVRVGEQEVRYVTGAIWTDRPARLLRAAIAERLRRLSSNAVIAGQGLELVPTWRIAGRLTQFQASTRGGIAGPVRVGVELMLLRGNNLVASQRFEAGADAASDRPADLAAAFNRAASDVTLAAADWAATTVDAKTR